MIMNSRGVIGMPVKLAVAFLIVATMIPLVIDAMDTAEDTLSLSGVEPEGRVLVNAISKANYDPVGSVNSVELHIPVGKSIEVGGDGYLGYVVRLLDDGKEIGRILLDRPSVPVLGDVVTISGTVTVHVTTCMTDDGRIGVKVTV